jgi:hypothetical protein
VRPLSSTHLYVWAKAAALPAASRIAIETSDGARVFMIAPSGTMIKMLAKSLA